jgi:hypothetical protein
MDIDFFNLLIHINENKKLKYVMCKCHCYCQSGFQLTRLLTTNNLCVYIPQSLEIIGESFNMVNIKYSTPFDKIK